MQYLKIWFADCSTEKYRWNITNHQCTKYDCIILGYD